VKHFSEILQVCELEVDILFIEIQSGESVGPDRIQSEEAILAHVLFVVAHGVAYSKQTFSHLIDQLLVESDES